MTREMFLSVLARHQYKAEWVLDHNMIRTKCGKCPLTFMADVVKGEEFDVTDAVNAGVNVGLSVDDAREFLDACDFSVSRLEYLEEGEMGLDWGSAFQRETEKRDLRRGLLRAVELSEGELESESEEELFE